MSAPSNKQRIINQLLSTLPHYREVSEENGKSDSKPVLEQFIYGLCRQGITEEKADRAFRNLGDQFFDWNEIRVSSVKEVAEALKDLPYPETRAHRIIQFLQEVFETTFSFDLEILQKKGLKHAAKQLSRYEVADDFVVSWVVQRSLGGHAIPVDEPTVRVLKRLGLVDDSQSEVESIRTSLEHQIPKAKGKRFCDSVSEFASSICKGKDPLCSNCPLVSDCLYVHELTSEPGADAIPVTSKVR